jgi:hypothetical protein
MPIFPKGHAPHLQGLGKYTQYDAMGFSKTQPREGDVVLTPRGVYWRVEAVEPYDQGDVNVYYLVGFTQTYLFSNMIDLGWFGYACIVEGVSGYESDLAAVSGYARNQTGIGL